MIEASAHAVPFETGGILLGVRTPDGLWITEAIEMQTEKRSRRSFVIPRDSTKALVDKRRSHDSRLGYIGDWHSHPSQLGASSIDLRTLARLAVGPFRRRRFVIVVRLSGLVWLLDVWALGGLRLPSRHPFGLTGPLHPAPGPYLE